jgi:hypothetical protein
MSRFTFSAGSQRRAGRRRHKKKKVETAVEPQIHSRVIVPKLKHFANAIFWPGPPNPNRAPSCYTGPTGLD